MSVPSTPRQAVGARFAARLLLAALAIPPLLPTLTTEARAQQRRAPTERELVAKINDAFRSLQAGDRDGGRLRLTDALRAVRDSNYDALTIRAYLSAVTFFERRRDTTTASELFAEAANTRAARDSSPDATTLWFEYARFLERTVQYERGIPVAVEASKRMRAVYGPNSAQDIAGRDILATLLTDNGAVAAGLNLSEETYLGARKALGDKEPLTWRTENNYAEALRMVGHPDLAAKIDAPLLKKRIAHYGVGSIQALVSASNLALDHLAMGNEAETMQALALQKRCATELADPTSEHVAQADTWIAYAKAYFHPERTLPAPELEAMARVKDWNGAPDLLRIKSAQLAADQYERRGDTERALALRIDAYHRAQETIARQHPITFDALLGVAVTRMKRGDADALATFKDVEQQSFRWMLREVGTAGNRYVAETMRKLADDILYEYGRYALIDPAAAVAYADAVSRWKTMEDGERTLLRLTLDRLPDEPTRELARTVLRLSGQQQEMLSSGKLDDDARDVLKRLQEARQQLAARVGAKPPADVQLPSVEDKLTETDALIDFFVSDRGSRVKPTEPKPAARLQAVVRRHGKPPQVIDLGPLDGFTAPSVVEADRAQPFRRLYATLIGPLKPQLAGVTRLFLVPDADLYSLPFAMLQDGNGRYLDEIYDTRILTRADAIVFAEQDDRLIAGSKAVLVGGLDYAGAASQLPSTKTEIDRIAPDLQRRDIARVMLTGDSGETAIHDKAEGAALLHLATHGFYKAATDRTDALWRSGIVAARPLLDRPPRRDGDDGVIYARELMDWNLSAAELVVLSACQTALGDPSRIGSVRGLPTALAIAGARRSLLTLWEVSDAGTANFMARLYQVLADDNLDYASALRKVRIEAIHGKIKAAEDPSVWAAFVLFEN
ncbi:CHAT domain-containing protein [Rhodopseudomonas sp. BR0M22]|uniref:CHAT domain-containing protein n=1 Tax=Rhodopseudomonas sp. BR0M22 TaxID=2269369 RepID=UPI0013DF194E|nr:CHAT domain-containing protein [Rhodopseudomonas sp. BR0M22]NEW92617.1 CHAT domain-containing protein [Rhodopseudomonas sp. BR0M22]